ncbi:hypothetical protein CBOM_04339 [Ceraceosorus bombacis]|uniref:Uncharacterized protein n=1 Tax=Ceraceosorus bombacis TaxID=401625 RepID=A0A0P1BQC1_9BASI|nr:hypothetical protein CBOM_04339 [Ceraceosorus bombacis]
MNARRMEQALNKLTLAQLKGHLELAVTLACVQQSSTRSSMGCFVAMLLCPADEANNEADSPSGPSRGGPSSSSRDAPNNESGGTLSGAALRRGRSGGRGRDRGRGTGPVPVSPQQRTGASGNPFASPLGARDSRGRFTSGGRGRGRGRGRGSR